MTLIENIPFSQALEEYICSKDKLLSPSTVRGYRTMQKNCFDLINDILLDDLNEKIIQRWVNTLAVKYSAKSINYFSLLQ